MQPDNSDRCQEAQFGVGQRLELADPTPRATGEVVAVTSGGYFTVKFEDGRRYVNYPPEDMDKFSSPSVTNMRDTGND
jgi:hypothetical protein